MMIRKFLTASLVFTLSFVCIVYQLHAKNTEFLSEAEQYLEPNDSENKAAIQEKSKEINILLNTYFDFNSAFGRQLGHFGPGGKQTVRELMSSLVQFLEPCDSGIEERLAAYEEGTMDDPDASKNMLANFKRLKDHFSDIKNFFNLYDEFNDETLDAKKATVLIKLLNKIIGNMKAEPLFKETPVDQRKCRDWLLLSPGFHNEDLAAIERRIYGSSIIKTATGIEKYNTILMQREEIKDLLNLNLGFDCAFGSHKTFGRHKSLGELLSMLSYFLSSFDDNAEERLAAYEERWDADLEAPKNMSANLKKLRDFLHDYRRNCLNPRIPRMFLILKPYSYTQKTIEDYENALDKYLKKQKRLIKKLNSILVYVKTEPLFRATPSFKETKSGIRNKDLADIEFHAQAGPVTRLLTWVKSFFHD